MANKRITKKKQKQSLMLYDANSCPKDKTFKDIIKIKQETGVIIYTTQYGGNKPAIIPTQNTKYFKLREVYSWETIN